MKKLNILLATLMVALSFTVVGCDGSNSSRHHLVRHRFDNTNTVETVKEYQVANPNYVAGSRGDTGNQFLLYYLLFCNNNWLYTSSYSPLTASGFQSATWSQSSTLPAAIPANSQGQPLDPENTVTTTENSFPAQVQSEMAEYNAWQPASPAEEAQIDSSSSETSQSEVAPSETTPSESSPSESSSSSESSSGGGESSSGGDSGGGGGGDGGE